MIITDPDHFCEWRGIPPTRRGQTTVYFYCIRCLKIEKRELPWR